MCLQTKATELQVVTSTNVARFTFFGNYYDWVVQGLMVLNLMFVLYFIMSEVDEMRICYYQHRRSDVTKCGCALCAQDNVRAVRAHARRSSGKAAQASASSFIGKLSMHLGHQEDVEGGGGGGDAADEGASHPPHSRRTGHCKAGERCFCHRKDFKWRHAMKTYLSNYW